MKILNRQSHRYLPVSVMGFSWTNHSLIFPHHLSLKHQEVHLAPLWYRLCCIKYHLFQIKLANHLLPHHPHQHISSLMEPERKLLGFCDLNDLMKLNNPDQHPEIKKECIFDFAALAGVRHKFAQEN